LYSVYSLAQLIFSPIWGSLSDRFGRRPIMLMSTLGAFFAYLLFAASHTLGLLFISRIIAGIMGGNIAAAQAYVADVTAPQDRARGMGLIGAAFGIGFMIGPAVSTLLIHPSFLQTAGIPPESRFALPGIFAAGMSLISFLLVLFLLPESVRPTENRDAQRPVKTSLFLPAFWRSIFEAKAPGSTGLFPLLILCAFLLSFSQASLYAAFPLYCKQRLNLSAESVGIQFAFMGLIAVLVQGGLLRRLTAWFAEEKLFLAGSVLMTAGFAFLAFAFSHSSLTVFLGMMTLGASLNGPTLNSLISKEADPSQMGRALGTSQGIASLGRVLGPTWGGLLFSLGMRVPFLATAAVLSVTAWVGFKLRTRRPAGTAE
ncbi:MAG: MFS transporter, partial [Candidatus Omnitrophica bacterium]|nr:MFS transporter [Candidatus Omnitrophota bacterium]